MLVLYLDLISSAIFNWHNYTKGIFQEKVNGACQEVMLADNKLLNEL